MSHLDPNVQRHHESSKVFGVLKLMRQITILATRIRKETTKFVAQFKTTQKTPKIFDELLLDVETYYTVAHDLLKLAEQYLYPDDERQFRRSGVYRSIASIRSHLIRHAYDKPDGTPTLCLTVTEEKGPILGSVLYGYRDDHGFNANHQDLLGLINAFRTQMHYRCINCGSFLPDSSQMLSEWVTRCTSCGRTNEVIATFRLMCWR